MKYLVDLSQYQYGEFCQIFVPIYFKDKEDIQAFKKAYQNAAERYLKLANEDDDAFWILKKEVDEYLELNKDNLSKLEKDTYTEEQYEAFDKGNIEKYQAKAFEWNGIFMDLSTICRSKDVVEPIIKTI